MWHSVSSYNEWFAHTVHTSLESVLGHMEGHKRDINIPVVTHNIRNCLDLIDSLGLFVCLFVCWSLTSLCHSNRHIETN